MEFDGKRQRFRGKAFRFWLFLCALVVALLLFPVRNETIRLALISGILGVWAGVLFFFCKRLPVRIFCLLPLPILGLLIFLPGQTVKADSLRHAYVSALKTYAGTLYIWGGETRTGIDCSGLVRQGLVRAEVIEGLSVGNAALLREAAYLWWDDCSARALGEQYRGRTVLQTKLGRLNDIDYQRIHEGDLAVTGDGIHVLAYIGNHQWIQADPQAGRVITTPIPSEDNRLNLDATMVRWRILTPSEP